MDSAASIGAGDRLVEQANDILAVDPSNERATALMLERATLERSLPGGQRALRQPGVRDIVQSTDMAEVEGPARSHSGRLCPLPPGGGRDNRGTGRPVCLSSRADGVVACFGYPVAHEGRRANGRSLAALRLVERMEHAGIELKRRHDIEPAIRVGVHSGTVVIAGLASGVIDGSALAGSVSECSGARGRVRQSPAQCASARRPTSWLRSTSSYTRLGGAAKGIARPVELHVVVRSNLTASTSSRGLPERGHLSAART